MMLFVWKYSKCVTYLLGLSILNSVHRENSFKYSIIQLVGNPNSYIYRVVKIQLILLLYLFCSLSLYRNLI